MLSVVLKMEKIEYRAVIMFFVKEGLTPSENYSRLVKVYGNSSTSFSTVKKWAAVFKPAWKTIHVKDVQKPVSYTHLKIINITF